MSPRIAPNHLERCVYDMTPRLIQPRLLATAVGTVLAVLLSTPTFAGGADVSTDEIFSDGLTLTAEDGSPLDIDGDGDTDLAIAGNRGGAIESSRYHLGNGDGTFSDAVPLTGGRSSEIAAADMNNDTFIDLVQGRRDVTDLLHLGDGVGSLLPGVATSADENRVLDVALGDLDNDGDMDIVTGNGRLGGDQLNLPQANRFYLNDNANNFAGADISADADDTASIELADLDGDGDLDVIASGDQTTANANRIYLNQFVESAFTTVSFLAGVDFGPADDETSKILIGDLDNDGSPDIVVLNHVGPQSPGTNRFFLNESLAFALQMGAATDVSADTDDTSGGVLADFDGDGDLDLAVANLLAGAVGSSRNRLYLNQFIESGTVSFAAGIDISTDEQMSRSMSAADLNGDGDIDIVVGNEDNIVDVSGRDRRYLNNGTADPFANVAPVIDSAVGTFTMDEDTDLTLVPGDLVVTDPDNVFPADFTLTVQEGSNYSVTGSTVTPDVGFAGDLTVPVVVNDGTDDSNTFNLTVTVNDTLNHTPGFTSAPVIDADEGVEYSYAVTTADADLGEIPAITAPTLPAWLTFTNNGDGTASLSGTPGAGDAGDHDVVLRASDGIAATDQIFTITVTGIPDPNNPPAFDSTPVTAATEGTAYLYEAEASDADGDTLTMTAPTLPAWLTFSDNGDGTATLMGTPGAGDAGDHDVSVVVSDGTGMAEQEFVITVSAITPPPNNAPAFTSTAVIDASEGTTYTYDITTSDADAGDELTITAATLPDWLTVNDNGDGTAALTGTPAAGDVGDHDVSLEVSDGADTAVQEFTITVEADDTVVPPPPSGGGGGGGSLGFLSLLALMAFRATTGRRRRLI